MLQLHGVSKRFGERVVLDAVTFGVAAGRMTGFVGGNSAGKTTTMRIILGVMSADGGTITLDDAPLGPADRRRFGYMPEERGLYPKMGVREQLVYLGQLHGWTAGAATSHADSLIEQLGLAGRAGDLIETLSLGNQQRAQVAAALVHQPDVLILDEPFSGLDPLAVEQVQQVLAGRAAAGVPVLFSSHQLDIVERLCDDLVILADGRIAASGSGAELRARHSSEVWRLEADDLSWVPDWLTGRGHMVGEPNGRVDVAATPEVRDAMLAAAVARGGVRRWQPVQPTLAEIFKEVVR